MGIVAILLINMLIAMMGNTYQKIAETRNEWQRQVKIKSKLNSIESRFVILLKIMTTVLTLSTRCHDNHILSFLVGQNSSCSRERSQSARTTETIDGVFSTNVRWKKSFSPPFKSIGNNYSESGGIYQLQYFQGIR